MTRLAALVPVGLAAFVFLVASAAWWEHRTTSDLPQRITVHSRDYAKVDGVPVDLASARDGAGTWQRMGTAGSHDRPVFGSVLSDDAPTVVYVQLGPDRYEAYALLGGP